MRVKSIGFAIKFNQIELILTLNDLNVPEFICDMFLNRIFSIK